MKQILPDHFPEYPMKGLVWDIWLVDAFPSWHIIFKEPKIPNRLELFTELYMQRLIPHSLVPQI